MAVLVDCLVAIAVQAAHTLGAFGVSEVVVTAGANASYATAVLGIVGSVKASIRALVSVGVKGQSLVRVAVV